MKIYTGEIRLGGKDSYSEFPVDVYQCGNCGVIWNDYQNDSNYYESGKYREIVEGTSDIKSYYRLHDGEVLRHLTWTGTSIFRDKIVADIGCAGGSFLDFIHGVAKETIAVEPSEIYRKSLPEKSHKVFQYAGDAIVSYEGKVDVVTSFDVIEHVQDPITFVNDIFRLLKPNGKVVIGTPTDHPVLRELLGTTFDRFIFQANHPWVFSENCLKKLFENDFCDIEVSQKNLYGLGNCLHWLQTEKPMGDVSYGFISETLNKVWKEELCRIGKGDYLVLSAVKKRG